MRDEADAGRQPPRNGLQLKELDEQSNRDN
jgi:hypothetical protein